MICSFLLTKKDGNTEIFSTSGVLQGDKLAPFLFITLLDYVLRETLLDNIYGFTITPRRSSRYPAVRIGALVYADDIAITCDTIYQAENVLRRLKMNASKVGLQINLKNEDPARWTQFSAESSYNDKRIYSQNLQ